MCQSGCGALKQMELNKMISSLFPPVIRMMKLETWRWLNEQVLHLHVFMPGAKVDLFC